MSEMKTTDIKVESNVRIGELTLSDSFVASIAQLGIIQPLVVDPDGVLIAGHRRLAAARQLGLASVPVHVRETDGSTAVQVAENVHRENLTDYELAQAVMDLKDEGMKHAEIASALSIDKKEISKLVKAGKVKVEPVDGQQISLDGLVAIADAVKESELPADELASAITRGEARSVYDSVQVVRAEHKEIEVMDELAELQAEWAEFGIEVVIGDSPRDRGMEGKTDQWGYPKKNPNVLKLIESEYGEGIKVPLADHIKLSCHLVNIRPGEGRRNTTWTHYCMDVKSHRAKGSSDLKSTNARAGTGMSDKEKEQRREERLAKQQRRLQAATFLTTHRTKKTDRYQWALEMANEVTREETVRAVTMALIEVGEVEKRPKGAAPGWYGQKLDAYLMERFGMDENDEYTTEAREFMLLAQMAFEFIERPSWDKWGFAFTGIEAAEVSK